MLRRQRGTQVEVAAYARTQVKVAAYARFASPPPPPHVGCHVPVGASLVRTERGLDAGAISLEGPHESVHCCPLLADRRRTLRKHRVPCPVTGWMAACDASAAKRAGIVA